MLSAALGGFAGMESEKSEAPNLQQPRRLGGYELLGEIARGGMGIVFRARQRRPDRQVALKVIAAGELASPRMIQRFYAETEAVARLDHPNIASIYEAGQEDGWHYFSMRLVEGPTLGHFQDGRPLPLRQAAELLVKVARAVHHAHQRGVLHRDLKPNNILLDATGEPVLTDFGLAKILESDSSLTLSQAVLGTPSYMSPEQASGDTKDATVAADIYSLGAVLYEMLTGRPPFSAPNTPLLLRKIVEDDPPPPSAFRSARSKQSEAESEQASGELNRDLEVICLKCLEKQPERRYNSAAELADDLERCLRHEPILARPISTWERVLKWSRRHRGFVAATATILLLLVASTAISTWAAVRATRAERGQSQLRLAVEAQSYAADMSLAQQALGQNNVGRARELLLRHKPQNPQSDLRGWEWRHLWQQTQSDADYHLARLGHSVSSLSASSDGQFLAAGQNLGGVVVFDLKARAEVFRDECEVRTVVTAFSPREPLLAYSFFEQELPSVRLWNAAARTNVAEIRVPFHCLRLQFAEDGQSLLIYGLGPKAALLLWNLAEQRFAAAMDANPPESSEMAASADLSLVADSVSGGKLRFINLPAQQVLWTVQATDEEIQALALAPNASMIASAAGYTDSTIHLWAADSGRELGRLDGHLSYVHALRFLPDGKTLLSASSDQTIRLWNVETRRPIAVLRGHRQEVWCEALLPDQRTLVSGDKGGAILVWNLDRARRSQGHIQIPARAQGWAFTADSQAVVLGENSGLLSEWSGPEFAQRRILHHFGTSIARACFNADGSIVAVEFPDRHALVWDLKSSNVIAQFVLPPGRSYVKELSPRGDRLYLDNSDGEDFHEWNVIENRLEQSWRVPGPFARAAAYSSDGRWRIVPNLHGGTVARDLKAQTNRSFTLNIVEPDAAALSPDTQLLAVTSLHGYVQLWEWPSLRAARTLRGFLQGAHSALFSPDGKRLLAGSSGREALKLWDLSTGRDVLTLEAEGSIFTRLRFSPDGNLIGARSSGGSVCIWRAPSAEAIRTSGL